MLDPAEDTRSKTLCDWVGVFCLLGCFLATVGLSLFGVTCIWRKGLYLEAIDAVLSMLKLLALNCGLLLASWAVFYFCHQNVLGVIMIAQHVLIVIPALLFEGVTFPDVTESQEGCLIPFTMAFIVRLMFVLIGWSERCTMPFVRRAISKGVTWTLLVSYGLTILFIALAALGVFGLRADPVTLFGKIASSIIACGAILCLAVAARILRVLHAAKMVHSRGLLGSLESDKVTAFVISHHLGSTFFCYAISCILLMGIAVLCTLSEDHICIAILTVLVIPASIMLFPAYDSICGTRMLIRKKSIWDEWGASLDLYLKIPACSMPIILLQNTGLISSFGGLYFAHKFGLQLFGSVQLLSPFALMTCTAIYLANNLLFANMVAESPAQIGIYLNTPHAVDVTEIPESEFESATCELR